MKPPVIKKVNPKRDSDDGEDTDPELEAFAEKVIAKEMKRLAGGQGEESADDDEDDEALDELKDDDENESK
jgi:hypothetical protein